MLIIQSVFILFSFVVRSLQAEFFLIKFICWEKMHMYIHDKVSQILIELWKVGERKIPMMIFKVIIFGLQDKWEFPGVPVLTKNRIFRDTP